MSDIGLAPATPQPNSLEGGANPGVLHTPKLVRQTYRTLIALDAKSTIQ